MGPPNAERGPGGGRAAVLTGNELATKHSAPVAYVKRATLLGLIARIVAAKAAPRRVPLRCGGRARA
jgi:hypothetical protein